MGKNRFREMFVFFLTFTLDILRNCNLGNTLKDTFILNSSSCQPEVNEGSSNSVADYYNDVSYSAVTIKPATESQGTPNDGFIGWLRLSGNHQNPGQYTDEKDADKKD